MGCFWDNGCATPAKCKAEKTCCARRFSELRREEVKRGIVTNDVTALKLRIAQLETANRSLLLRVENQADMIRTVNAMVREVVIEARNATRMLEGIQKYIAELRD